MAKFQVGKKYLAKQSLVLLSANINLDEFHKNCVHYKDKRKNATHKM